VHVEDHLDDLTQLVLLLGVALMHLQRAYAVFAEACDAHRMVAQRAIERHEATRPVMSSIEGYPEFTKEAEREKAPGIAKTS
jgi:hypothetical protein